MARLWSSGFELNSLTDGVEVTTTGGTVLISSTTVRSGSYSGRVNPTLGSGSFRYSFGVSGSGVDIVYIRFYLRIASAPNGNLDIFLVNDSGNDVMLGLLLTTDRILRLWDDFNGVQLGSDSSPLDLDTWYLVEFLQDSTNKANIVGTAKLNGSQFATGTANFTGFNSPDQAFFGTTTPSRTFDIFFDDIAINDSTGSFQNSWPGEGEIIHLRPNLEGDNDDWDGLNGYQEVYEVTPDDATTFYNTTTLNDIQDEQIDDTPVALASDDTINCVHVGARFNLNATASGYSFVTRFKKATGETVSESGNITPTTTTWMTNAIGASRNYPLTLYQNPDATTITKATLDTSQIGVRMSAENGSDDIQISTLWLVVDHKPAEAPAGYGNVFISNKNMLKVGV